MKIDTSKIEGFDAMSVEEQREALLGYEFEDSDSSELDKLQSLVKSQKAMIDKYSSQIADQKKKERESLDADARAKLEYEEKLKDLEEKLAAQEAVAKKADLVSRYKKLGYSDELAEDSADALLNGDMDRFFANGEKNRAEMEQKIKADKVKKTPPPAGSGAGSQAKTKEEIMKIKDAQERQKAISENLELFGLAD